MLVPAAGASLLPHGTTPPFQSVAHGQRQAAPPDSAMARDKYPHSRGGCVIKGMSSGRGKKSAAKFQFSAAKAPELARLGTGRGRGGGVGEGDSERPHAGVFLGTNASTRNWELHFLFSAEIFVWEGVAP